MARISLATQRRNDFLAAYPQCAVKGMDLALTVEFDLVWWRLSYDERSWCSEFVNVSVPMFEAMRDGWIARLTDAGFEELNDALGYIATRFMVSRAL